MLNLTLTISLSLSHTHSVSISLTLSYTYTHTQSLHTQFTISPVDLCSLLILTCFDLAFVFPPSFYCSTVAIFVVHFLKSMIHPATIKKQTKAHGNQTNTEQSCSFTPFSYTAKNDPVFFFFLFLPHYTVSHIYSFQSSHKSSLSDVGFGGISMCVKKGKCTFCYVGYQCLLSPLDLVFVPSYPC